MELETLCREELFKDSEDVRGARKEIKDLIESDLAKVSMTYGRANTSHALKKAWIDFNNRRWVNPHPIDDEQFKRLVEHTEGAQNKVHVNGRSPEEMADVFVTLVGDIDSGEDEIDPWRMVFEFTREELAVWVDLLLTNLFREERDEYVDVIVDRLTEEAEHEL